MKAENIKVEPFGEMTVADYRGIMQVNEQGIVRIVGNIPVSRMEEYISISTKPEPVKITAEERGEQCTLLYGTLTGFDISVENSTAILTLEVKTGTCQMEKKEHTRIFQDTSVTYREILNTCNECYANNGMIMTSGKETEVPEFIVQYRENDWQFIKRLASLNHTVLVPDTQTGGVKYYFGIPNRKKKQMPQTSSYKICRDLEEFEKKKQSGMQLNESDSINYIVESREIYGVGDCVIFLERELYIWRMESVMKGSELSHTYYMKTAKGIAAVSEYQRQVTGAALDGKVVKVKDDMVQVKLFEDENGDAPGHRWFPFSTVYSSPDGTGWYCMPECGDTVRLNFPSEKTEEAYVSSAVHEYSDERTKPEKKFLKNKQGKEICLAPDYILLSNNDGILIELSDRHGIKMESSSSILLQAKERIMLISDDSDISMNAAKRIRLQQGKSSVDISDEISMEGMQVRLH